MKNGKNTLIGVLVLVVLALASPYIASLIDKYGDQSVPTSHDAGTIQAASPTERKELEDVVSKQIDDFEKKEGLNSESDENLRNCHKLKQKLQSDEKYDETAHAACYDEAEAVEKDISDSQTRIEENEKEISDANRVLNDPNASPEDKRAAEERKKQLEEENERLRDHIEKQKKKLKLMSFLLKLAALYAFATGNTGAGEALVALAAYLDEGGEKPARPGGGGSGAEDMGDVDQKTKDKIAALEKTQTVVLSRDDEGSLFVSYDDNALRVWNSDDLIAVIPKGGEAIQFAANAQGELLEVLKPSHVIKFSRDICKLDFEQPDGKYYYAVPVEVDFDDAFEGLDCTKASKWIVRYDPPAISIQN